MHVVGVGTETFYYLNGIIVNEPFQLDESVVLMPASCSPDPNDMIHICINKCEGTEVDLGIACIFLRSVQAQIKVTAKNSEELAAKTWNAYHEIILLSALLNCEIEAAIQCSDKAENFNKNSKLHIVHYRFHIPSHPYFMITKEKQSWLSDNYKKSAALRENKAFTLALNSLWSFRWHTHPAMRMAVIWAGIESLFGMSAELAFRLSLSITLFLSTGEREKDKEFFKSVKELYGKRSKAVHGVVSKNKVEFDDVWASEKLLHSLIIKCVETGSLPPEDIEIVFAD